ncbi:MAG: hypothetical protein LWW86_10590 [Micrococcales bacterium]|nr:hypothetical protein [Micrococcales bacterium]
MRICHGTGSPDDPSGSVVIEPSETGVVNGHLVYNAAGALEPEEGHEGDIIPPFEYVNPKTKETVTYPGLNWPAGEATWENNCVAPAPTTTTTPPTTTTTPPTTTTPTTTTPTTTTPTPPATTSTRRLRRAPRR